uniref:Uncharacterized protein n=1 Tax=viral metagenome TaxID=1070528 RepID=A0A6H1Z8N2_9ZZZZ
MTDVTNYDPTAERVAREGELSTEAIRECIKQYRSVLGGLTAKGHPARGIKMSQHDATTADSALAAILKRVEELEAQNAVMREAINAVAGLIDESRGVYGLHLDGDTSPWDELLAGGRFEEWLVDLSAAFALTPDTGKRVVGVAWLREVRAVLLAMLDDGDSRGVYPTASTVGDIVDRLAALIGEGE